jgi:2,4-dienoyl-CoA reductase-like NADH-dependent reductase (Old Yellow Enzyme family)
VSTSPQSISAIPGEPPVGLDVLWEPVQIGTVEVRNRIVVTAHEALYGTIHTRNDAMGKQYAAYLAARARGGAGLVMPGGASVHPTGEKFGHLPLWPKESVGQYRILADAVHEHGAKVFVQLYHAGPQAAGLDFLENQHPPLAASALPSPVTQRVPKAMDRDDIGLIIHAYGVAATHMREAGIDGIELSAGHGYLLHSFFSPLANRRQDEYGGDVAGRCRLIVEVLAEIRAQVGRDYPVGVRMSFDDYIGGAGITHDIAQEILAELHQTGLVDLFSVSGGTYPTIDRMIPPALAGLEGQFASDGARARAVVGDNVPVLVAAGIRTVDVAARLVSEGSADLVGMARAHLADPDVVAKARAGRVSEVRRCTGANQGCVRRAANRNMITCTVNPVAGREQWWGTLPSAETRLRVLVAGGGPAGIKAAETAALRGHEVTLVERSDALGGQLRLAGALPGRSTWLEALEDLTGSIERLGIDVRLGQELTSQGVREFGADRVVIATGSYFQKNGFSSANPTRDGIPGADSHNVFSPVEVLEDLEVVGHRVVIVDDTGDIVPLGLALLLAGRGHEVEVVTAKLHAGSQLLWTLEFPWVYPQLGQAGVHLSEQTLVTRIDDGAVSVASIWGESEERTIDADSVVLVMERRSDDALYESLRAAGIDAQRIGDCVAPRDVDDAIYEGMKVGREL